MDMCTQGYTRPVLDLASVTMIEAGGTKTSIIVNTHKSVKALAFVSGPSVTRVLFMGHKILTLYLIVMKRCGKT